MNDIKRMSLKEFQNFGFLQEVNRQFFHPLGLALTLYYDENDLENKNGIDPEKDTPIGMFIQDWRDDPEGCMFEEVDVVKFENMRKLWEQNEAIRRARLGYMVQPLPTGDKNG